MPNPVVHFELMAGDAKPLYRFYSELFGWHVEEMQMGPDRPAYGVIDTHSDGKGINGGIATTPDGSSGTTIYAEVKDLQAMLDKAEKLGGKVAMEIEQVPGVVTFAQFLDPHGNRIGMVQEDPTIEVPPASKGSNPPITWFEILGTSGGPLAEFYTQLFGWTVESYGQPGIDYSHVETRAGKGIEGGLGASPMGQPNVQVYAEVDDLQAYLDRAVKLGGNAVMPPSDVGTVSIALFSDPAGNVFGLYRNND
jgi:predicted enzyme related to lactoylglutathione lyase